MAGRLYKPGYRVRAHAQPAPFSPDGSSQQARRANATIGIGAKAGRAYRSKTGLGRSGA